MGFAPAAVLPAAARVLVGRMAYDCYDPLCKARKVAYACARLSQAILSVTTGWVISSNLHSV